MMKLYNSLSKKVEEFKPIKPPNVGMYTCGPTVYSYATIGNFRTYTTADILYRTLKFVGYKVKYIMNLTDVGHLTGDNLGDADTGEDRLEKAAKKESKTAWDIADFYTKAFLTDFEKLNLSKPDKFVKATDHIQEQINLVQKLEENGLTYKTSDGIYFDTAKFSKKNSDYKKLTTLDKIKEGARVEPNPEKKNPTDFALWKFSPAGGEKRDMEWDSPWGVGFPGWHIECSAMSMKYLGETFDIHVGGEDLRSTHHPNEIAQAEGATGKKFVDCWVHGAFLQVDGGRMGKSLGNAYTVSDIEEKGFTALDLRYFYLTGKYREPLNFTWEALKNAQNSLNNLRKLVLAARTQTQRTVLSDEKMSKVRQYQDKFVSELSEDLNLPKTLAVTWEAMKSNIPSEDKYDLAMTFDQVLGLKLDQEQAVSSQMPKKIKDLIAQREKLRQERNFDEADKIRDEIVKSGFSVEDKSAQNG